MAKPKNGTKKALPVKIDCELYDKLKGVADEQGRTLTSQLERVLREWNPTP
jgi:hypothetical protein